MESEVLVALCVHMVYSQSRTAKPYQNTTTLGRSEVIANLDL